MTGTVSFHALGRAWLVVRAYSVDWGWATILPPWQMSAMGVVGAAIACLAKCGWWEGLQSFGLAQHVLL